jgi:hypothetical protein
MKRRDFLGFLGAGAFASEVRGIEKGKDLSREEFFEGVLQIVSDALGIDRSKIYVPNYASETYFVIQTNIGDVMVNFKNEIDLEDDYCLSIQMVKDYKLKERKIILRFNKTASFTLDEEERGDIKNGIEEYFSSHGVKSENIKSEEYDPEEFHKRINEVLKCVKQVSADYFKGPIRCGNEIIDFNISEDEDIDSLIEKLLPARSNNNLVADFCARFLISIRDNEPISLRYIRTMEYLLISYWMRKERDKKISAENIFHGINFDEIMRREEELSRKQIEKNTVSS